VTYRPITDRFGAYSAEDAAADGLWDEYKRAQPWETHRGALLHQQPPHIQHLVYDFAKLRAKGKGAPAA
jgi:hypothetical protein